MDAAEQGRKLAERHARLAADSDAGPLEVDRTLSVLNYAELPHPGDWTLRSGLTRLAQPHPVLVSAVLDLSRRLDAPLHHVRRALEANPAICDRGLTADNIGEPPIAPLTDLRTADLGRLVAAGADADQLIAGYGEPLPSADQLDNEERLSVPLLAVAVMFEGLAAVVTGWAVVGPNDPPAEAVQEVIDRVATELDRLGVPEETGPPPGMRRGGRSRG